MGKLSALIGGFTFGARIFLERDGAPERHSGEDGLVGRLHLVRAGTVVFRQDEGEALRVEGPALVFFPRGMAHRVEVPYAGATRMACAAIVFDDGGANPLTWALPDRMHIPLQDLSSLHQTLDIVFAEAAAPSQGRDVLLQRLCEVLMIQIVRHEFDRGNLDAGVLAGLTDRQLAPVLNAMHAQPDAPWQLHTLATIACMSRAGFTEHFRNIIGIPPMEYLTRWRMGLACRLLRKGLPVKVVSGRAGYTSPPAFTRAFTDHVGASPRQWLREFAPLPAEVD